jgi:secondary thiamine-phosphate synthase enzyme
MSGKLLAMRTVEIDVDMSRERIKDVTDDVIDFCRGEGDGLVNVFVPHATAGLAVMELGSGSEPDLEELVDRLLPRDDRYRHRHGTRGHGADHLLPVLINPTLMLPVRDGEPLLGTWQRIAFVDFNADNPRRKLRLTFIAG